MFILAWFNHPSPLLTCVGSLFWRITKFKNITQDLLSADFSFSWTIWRRTSFFMIPLTFLKSPFPLAAKHPHSSNTTTSMFVSRYSVLGVKGHTFWPPIAAHFRQPTPFFFHLNTKRSSRRFFFFMLSFKVPHLEQEHSDWTAASESEVMLNTLDCGRWFSAASSRTWRHNCVTLCRFGEKPLLINNRTKFHGYFLVMCSTQNRTHHRNIWVVRIGAHEWHDVHDLYAHVWKLSGMTVTLI